jgi:hypothetical protein
MRLLSTTTPCAENASWRSFSVVLKEIRRKLIPRPIRRKSAPPPSPKAPSGSGRHQGSLTRKNR